MTYLFNMSESSFLFLKRGSFVLKRSLFALRDITRPLTSRSNTLLQSSHVMGACSQLEIKRFLMKSSYVPFFNKTVPFPWLTGLITFMFLDIHNYSHNQIWVINTIRQGNEEMGKRLIPTVSTVGITYNLKNENKYDVGDPIDSIRKNPSDAALYEVMPLSLSFPESGL